MISYMESSLICPLCFATFSRRQTLDSHLKKKNPCVKSKIILPKKENKKQCAGAYLCHICDKDFASKFSLQRHVSLHKHKNKKEIDGEKYVTTDRMNEIISKLEAKINTNPSSITYNDIKNTIQVLCVSGNQNYYDILTDKMGDEYALDYIKSCALSSISGDCKLLEKIYAEAYKEGVMNIDDVALYYTGKNRDNIEYINENQERIKDPKGKQAIKKIANNLQNGYLKGMVKMQENFRDKLDSFDIDEWNQHVYNLSDEKYQRKIINNIDIPHRI